MLLFMLILIDALPFLTATIQSPNAREDSAATNATENAISAVAKICKYLESQAPLDNILPMWLSWLPVTEDKEEAPHIYSYLCDLIERLVVAVNFCIQCAHTEVIGSLVCPIIIFSVCMSV